MNGPNLKTTTGPSKMCKCCHFWDGDRTGTGTGKCHRRPPISSSEAQPDTNYDDWCGDFVVVNDAAHAP